MSGDLARPSPAIIRRLDPLRMIRTTRTVNSSLSKVGQERPRSGECGRDPSAEGGLRSAKAHTTTERALDGMWETSTTIGIRQTHGRDARANAQQYTHGLDAGDLAMPIR